MYRQRLRTTVTFAAIFLLGAFFRFYGLNWDQNQHLHPDERFLTMVVGGLKWPGSTAEYLDPQSSPLNPYNKNYGFFVYGTLPLTLVKATSEFFKFEEFDYNNIALVGRWLSAVFDLGTLVLVLLISQKLFKNHPEGEGSLHLRGIAISWPLLAVFFYAASVLPIQLSHFFAVDTFLVFFLILCFYLLLCVILSGAKNPDETSRRFVLIVALGLSFGLALACKVSALYFLPVVLLGFSLGILPYLRCDRFSVKVITRASLRLLLVFVVFFSSAYLSLRLADPRIFATDDFFNPTPNPQFVKNLRELEAYSRPPAAFPPAVQWLSTRPIIFPLENMVLWGLGLPLGALAVVSVVSLVSLATTLIIQIIKVAVLRLKMGRKNRSAPDLTNFQGFSNDLGFTGVLLAVFWILLLFFYQGTQFVKATRYFYSLYPFLAIVSAAFLYRCYEFLKLKVPKKILLLTSYFLLPTFLIWPLAFLSIYSRPHSRVTASRWIYQNISAGATLTCEHWDDCLPLGVDGKSGSIYNFVEFPLYGEDTPEKWREMEEKLKRVDYIVMSSNRLYGSITGVPWKYPATSRYYQRLFDGSLGFTKVAEITSRPNIPLPWLKVCLTPPWAGYGALAKKVQECHEPGITFVDDYTDESFTVYDHPKVLVFKRL